MAITPYRNFDLQIQRDNEGTGYVARAQSPSGEGTARFVLPFSNLELEHFVLSITPGRGRTRRIDTPDVALAKRFGEQLFTTVFGGEVGGLLRASLSDAGAAGTKLRLRMRLNDAPELADLPWEYLYNSSLNRFLSLDDDTAIVRYLELPERVRPVTVTLPLRILVIISSPTDFPRLDVEQEWLHLQEALGDLLNHGMVSLDLLDGANLPALRRRLQTHQYHILHFIGHGGFDRSNQEGVLLMVDEAGRGRQISGQQLGWLLHNHKTLALAVLNACEGARADQADAFAGTAQSLVQQGIPAVVAMQFEITDGAAKTFASAFYSALAAGDSVESALTETRLAIFAEAQTLEWGTPVLFMRSPDGRLFDVHAPAPGTTPVVRGAGPTPVQTTPQPAPDPVQAPIPAPSQVPDPAPPVPPVPTSSKTTTPQAGVSRAQEPLVEPAPAPAPAPEPVVIPTAAQVSTPAPAPAPVVTPSAQPAVTPAPTPPSADPKLAQVAVLYNAAYAAMSERNWAAAISNAQTILMLVPGHPDALAILRYSLQQKDLQPAYPQPSPVTAQPAVSVTLRRKNAAVAFALEAIGLISPIQGLGHFYMGKWSLGLVSIGMRLLLSLVAVLVVLNVFSEFPPYQAFTIFGYVSPDFFEFLREEPLVALIAFMASVAAPVVSVALLFVNWRQTAQGTGDDSSGRTKIKTRVAAALEALGFFFPVQGLGHLYAGARILGTVLLFGTAIARVLLAVFLQSQTILSWRAVTFVFSPVVGIPSYIIFSSDYGSDFEYIAGQILSLIVLNLLIPAMSIGWLFFRGRKRR